MKKISDKRIKAVATQKEKYRVFESFGSGVDIWAHCSDGLWVRFFWQNPNGKFGWDKWKKV